MRLQYQLEKAGDHLVLNVTGEWQLDAMYELIDAIAGECRKHNCDNVLVNGLAMEIHGLVLEFERFLVGERVADVLQGIKLAAVFPAEQINKFGERIAVKRGAKLFVTSTQDEALQWLLSDGSAEHTPGD